MGGVDLVLGLVAASEQLGGCIAGLNKLAPGGGGVVGLGQAGDLLEQSLEVSGLSGATYSGSCDTSPVMPYASNSKIRAAGHWVPGDTARRMSSLT